MSNKSYFYEMNGRMVPPAAIQGFSTHGGERTWDLSLLPNLPYSRKKEDMPISHRPGSLRQENKKHKGTGNHQSKRSTKLAAGAGRVESGRVGPKAETKRAADARKSNRANHATQMRKKKREEVWLQKRLGSDDGPPKVCVWVSLSATADPAAIQKGLLENCTSCTEPSTGIGMVTASFNLFKQRATFLTPDRDLISALEFAKVADLLLLVLPVDQGADDAVDEVSAANVVS